MSGTRRHHYISQFYLRHFAASGNDRLYVVDKSRQKQFSTSPVNVAQERDFHRIDIIGYKPNTIEDALSHLEGAVASSLNMVLERGNVGEDEEAHTIFYYMALLLVKNPAMRSKMDDVAEQIMTTIAKQDASDPARFAAKVEQMIADGSMPPDTDVESLRQGILRDDYTLSMAREVHLDIEFENAKRLMPYFAGRKWVFIWAAEGQFVTCDRPIVLTRDNEGLLGLANPGVRILFPLSSEVAIIGAFDFSEGSISADRRAVAEFNAQVAWNAHRQIYARDEKFEYLASDGEIKPGLAIASDPVFVSPSEG